MAKRFTDTDKWKKPFFSDLSTEAKITWIYLLDNCDNTGVWALNLKLLSFQVGFTVTKKDLIEWFASKIAFIENDKVLIKPFIEFQYGKLNESNNAHKPVIKMLEKVGPIEDLISPSLGAQDKDKAKATDKDKDKDLVKDKAKDKDKEISVAEKTLNQKIWDSYSAAYFSRYKVEPTRNRVVNGQIANLASRIGQDAPEVVKFYLEHNDSFYLKNTHSIGLCLANAESLHTQWKRGKPVTAVDVKAFEQKQLYKTKAERDEEYMTALVEQFTEEARLTNGTT